MVSNRKGISQTRAERLKSRAEIAAHQATLEAARQMETKATFESSKTHQVRLSHAVTPTANQQISCSFDPDIVRLTEQYKQQKTTFLKHGIEDSWAMGQTLNNIKDKLPHGQWEIWAQEHVGFSHQYVQTMLRLGTFDVCPALPVGSVHRDVPLLTFTAEVVSELKAGKDLQEVLDAVKEKKPPKKREVKEVSEAKEIKPTEATKTTPTAVDKPAATVASTPAAAPTLPPRVDPSCARPRIWDDREIWSDIDKPSKDRLFMEWYEGPNAMWMRRELSDKRIDDGFDSNGFANERPEDTIIRLLKYYPQEIKRLQRILDNAGLYYDAEDTPVEDAPAAPARPISAARAKALEANKRNAAIRAAQPAKADESDDEPRMTISERAARRAQR